MRSPEEDSNYRYQYAVGDFRFRRYCMKDAMLATHVTPRAAAMLRCCDVAMNGESARTNGEHVVYEPLLSNLVHLGLAHETGALEHFMGGLKHALQM